MRRFLIGLMLLTNVAMADMMADIHECGERADKKEMLAAVNHKSEAEQKRIRQASFDRCFKFAMINQRIEIAQIKFEGNHDQTALDATLKELNAETDALTTK